MATLHSTKEERLKRVQDAVQLKEPDYVPFAPGVGNYFSRGYDISIYASMKDLRTVLPGIRGFLEDFSPDLGWVPGYYPTDAVELLECISIKCPGPGSGLDMESSFQMDDHALMTVEEYDDLIEDPGTFFLTKIYPRKYKALSFLSELTINNPLDSAFFGQLAIFDRPDVRLALDALKEAGRAAKVWNEGWGIIFEEFEKQGIPLGAGVGHPCAFDLLADTARGLVNTVTDIYTCPDKVLKAVEVLADLTVKQAVTRAKNAGTGYLFIPLHAGVDEFMSPENYKKFYWPGLQKLICALVDNDITPYIYCEGKYHQRLDILADVPKGKVIYTFEDVDIKKAKEVLGDVACIGGNLPTSLLAYGKKEQVIEETKRLLDIAAPGGGFMMDCSIILDNCKRENLEAWEETTRLYGKY